MEMRMSDELYCRMIWNWIIPALCMTAGLVGTATVGLTAYFFVECACR